MAKKKSKGKKKSQSKKTETKSHKKEKSNTGWIVGVIIVVIIIIAIVLLMRGVEEEPEQPTVTPPEEGSGPSEEEVMEGPSEVAEVPEEVKDCSIAYAIGYPKNKLLTPCEIEGNQPTIQLAYSGNADSLGGMWFKVTTADGDVKYLKDTRTVEKGETIKYSFDIGETIERVVAMPLITQNGEDKACLNQRLIVIKSTNCVGG